MQSQAENKYSSCVFNQGLKLEKVEYNFKQGYQESKKATTFFFFFFTRMAFFKATVLESYG